jgi:uncharacterized protein YqjF (DUF2071 family)
MAQRWSNLLFMHRPAKVDALRALVPPALTLDLLSSVAFMLGDALLGSSRLSGRGPRLAGRSDGGPDCARYR